MTKQALFSQRNLGSVPAGESLSAEDVLEFHAARILLLLSHVGNGSIDGLKKIAKLDFFVRYPAFFAEACVFLGKAPPPGLQAIETHMVRHHYGPWDHRYYHILAFLESTQTIKVSKVRARMYRFEITETGQQFAERLSALPSFQDQIKRMKRVRAVLGQKNGEALQDLVYSLFEKEIGKRELGETIS